MPNEVIVGMISFLVGAVAGVILYYNIGEPKCQHDWEKIIDDHYHGACSHAVVHMCRKCGKRIELYEVR